MIYQDQLIKNLIDELERAIERKLSHPCINNAQRIAEAKHKIMEFMKNAK